MPARLLALVALFAACLAFAGRVGPRPPLPAHAQAPAEPALSATMYGNSVRFRTVPSSSVTAELVDPAGGSAQGIGVAGPDGLADVEFMSGNVTVRPGVTIVLSRPGQQPLRVSVPELSAGLDLAGDRVVGTAPPGATLRIALTQPAALQRTVTAGADGKYELNLAGVADLRPGGAAGSVAYTTTDDRRFTATFAALSLDLTLGARDLRFGATPGTTVAGEVRRADGGTVALGPQPVTGGGMGTLYLAAPDGRPLIPGDTVTLRQTGGPAGTDQALEATLAALTVALNPQTDQVTGTAPAGTEVELAADGMDGQTAQASAVADAGGAYTADLAGRADLGPGWRVRAAYAPAEGVRLGALAVLRMLRVGVHLPLAQGRAEPGRVLTMTLRSAAGVTKAQRASWVDDQGEYTAFFGSFFALDDIPVTAEPGDVVEVAFETGDPSVWLVPALSARADVAADTVSGSAPAGATVHVRVESAPGQPTASAAADGAGAYRASFAGTVDLARPASGSVWLTEGGAEFYTTWAAMQLSVTLGSMLSQNFVAGNGPNWRMVTATLTAPDGRTVGAGRGTVFGGNIVIIGPGSVMTPQFFLTLTDITGAPVTMQPGDTLRVTGGDEEVVLPIPPLDALVDVRDDRVNGRAAPNARVTLRVAGDGLSGTGATAETTADAVGLFSHSFAGQFDIRYGDFVQLSATAGDHTILNAVLAPGAQLDLDESVFVGALAPNADARVTLNRGTQVLADLPVTAADDGGFAVQFTDAAGAPLPLRQGDVIEVIPRRADVFPLILTVPELTVTADVASDTVTGRATPGGALTLMATEAYERSDTLGVAQAWPALTSEGAYRADFVPGVNVRPGTRVQAVYRPPAGHYVLRSHVVPILNAELAGPNACGYGPPRQPVTASLADAAGTRLAEARAQAAASGFFSAVLADGAKQPVATAAGQTERATLGALPAEVTFPSLDLQVDWRSGLIRGTGPANTPFVVQPAVPCPAQGPGAGITIMIRFGGQDQTGPDGSFMAFMPPDMLGPGGGVEFAFFAPSEHRVFRHLYRVQGRIFVAMDRVTGQANPLEPLTLVLRAPDGSERGRAQVRADASGAFDAALRDGAGRPVASAPGDTVLLQAQAEAPAVKVETLAFDWSPGGPPVVGQAPRWRALQVVLRLADGQLLTIPRTADAAGTFRLGAEEVPPRAAWAWTDVVAVRLVLPTPDGHQMVAQTEGFESPAGPVRRPVYLPIAYAKGRGAAVAAAGAIRSDQAGAAAGAGTPSGVGAATPPVVARARALDAAATPRRELGWLGARGEAVQGRRLIQPMGGWRHDPFTAGADWPAAHGRPTTLRIP